MYIEGLHLIVLRKLMFLVSVRCSFADLSIHQLTLSFPEIVEQIPMSTSWKPRSPTAIKKGNMVQRC